MTETNAASIKLSCVVFSAQGKQVSRRWIEVVLFSSTWYAIKYVVRPACSDGVSHTVENTGAYQNLGSINPKPGQARVY